MMRSASAEDIAPFPFVWAITLKALRTNRASAAMIGEFFIRSFITFEYMNKRLGLVGPVVTALYDAKNYCPQMPERNSPVASREGGWKPGRPGAPFSYCKNSCI